MHSISNHPVDLSIKVKLLAKFTDYLSHSARNKSCLTPSQPMTSSSPGSVVLKTWYKTTKGFIFVFNNNFVQACFKDGAELFLNLRDSSVGFVNARDNLTWFGDEKQLGSAENPEMLSKLLYVRNKICASANATKITNEFSNNHYDTTVASPNIGLSQLF